MNEQPNKYGIRQIILCLLSTIIPAVILLTGCFFKQENGRSDGINAPVNLTAEALAPHVISLNWSDDTFNELGFIIQRSTDGVDYTSIIEVSQNEVAYIDENLLPNTLYFYRVAAFNAVMQSSWSLVAEGRTHELDPVSTPGPSVTGNTPTKSTTPEWMWASNNPDGIGTFRYRLNNSDLTSMAETDSISYAADGLSEGIHILYVQEKNTDGTWSSTGLHAIRVLKSLGIIGNTVLVDEFADINPEVWYSWIPNHASQTPSPLGMLFTVNADADASTYSNSEIIDAGNDEFHTDTKPYFRNFAQMYLRNINPGIGSRGWGYWNGTLDQNLSEIAWFSFVNGPEGYPYDGLYAVSQIRGEGPVMTHIPGIDIQKWHNYSIDWREDGVTYWIDDSLVATHTEGVPTGYMRFDVWVDNAIYDENWNHLCQDITMDTSIDLDSIVIYSLPDPYGL